MKDMTGEAMVKKYQEGPVGHILIGANGVPNMGKYLGLWFLWSLVVAIVAGYLAIRMYHLNPAKVVGAAKLVGAVTFIAHGFGTISESIWMMRPWSSSAKYLLDAALYALSSAAVFYWLWP
jgi:hypothetical protein